MYSRNGCVTYEHESAFSLFLMHAGGELNCSIPFSSENRMVNCKSTAYSNNNKNYHLNCISLMSNSVIKHILPHFLLMTAASCTTSDTQTE